MNAVQETVVIGNTSIDMIFPQPWHCEHKETQLRRRFNAVASAMHGLQCLCCGGLVGNWWAKERVKDREVGEWDMELSGVWRKKQTEYSKKYYEWRVKRDGILQVKREAEQGKKLSEYDRWWTEYSDYLNSPEWKAKRRKVIERAKGICEGCGINATEEVHHLTYARAGREMLFDLVALCVECHHAIHGERDARIR